MDNIIIIGGGGHSKVLISIIKKINIYNIHGYIDSVDKGKILNVKYLGDDLLAESLYRDGIKLAILGVGQIKDANARKKIVKHYSSFGFSFPIIISPHSIVNEDVDIGNGTVIIDGAVINSGSNIGKYSIINTSASVDHDCRVGNFTHIAPGVTLSGGVEIGNECLIGTGVSITQYVRIPNKTIIGAGSVVTKDIQESGVYVGVPGRRVK